MEPILFLKRFSDQFEDVDKKSITLDTQYKSLDSWDSLTAFSIQAMVEEEYNVEINSDEIKSVNTVEELFLLVKSKA